MLNRSNGTRFAAFALAALGVAAMPIRANAQDDSGGSPLPTAHVSLNVESADLYYTLKLLFQQIKAKFTLDPSLKGTAVTVNLPDVPFNLALNAVLKASNQPLTYTYENGIFSIVPKETAAPVLPPSADAVQPTTPADQIPIKIQLNLSSVTDVGTALGIPIIRQQQITGTAGGFGGGMGGGMGGGGMGSGGFGGGTGGFGGGSGGLGGGGFGGGTGGFGGGGSSFGGGGGSSFGGGGRGF